MWFKETILLRVCFSGVIKTVNGDLDEPWRCHDIQQMPVLLPLRDLFVDWQCFLTGYQIYWQIKVINEGGQWGHMVNARATGDNGLIKRASSTIRAVLDSGQQVAEVTMLRKPNRILDNHSRSLHDLTVFQESTSSHRLSAGWNAAGSPSCQQSSLFLTANRSHLHFTVSIWISVYSETTYFLVYIIECWSVCRCCNKGIICNIHKK